VLGYTIAAEIGDIDRFSAPAKLISYTGLCPRVRQSGDVDRRGALSKHGPPYLRWALIEAAHNAIRCYPPYRALAERQRARLGRHPWRQRRRDHDRAQARRGKLVDAHPQPSLCSGRRQGPFDRLTVPK